MCRVELGIGIHLEGDFRELSKCNFAHLGIDTRI